MNAADPRIDAVRNGLTHPTQVVGENTRWTMEERLAHYACPAVSVAVIENGDLAWSEAFGLMEAGAEAPATPDALFSGASISKPITAAMALHYVERGRLDLDTDINRYLTSWRLPENEFTLGRPVTLRHLLSHTAGTTVHGFGGMPPGSDLPTLLDVLEGRPPALTAPVRVDKKPGHSVRYSGGGSMIVQLVLEELSGKPFANLARELVFDPLGMDRTTFENPLPESIREGAAVGHEGGSPIPGKWVCVPQLAAGGVWTTARDYARFMIACRNAWLGIPSPLFGKRLAEQMMTSQGGLFGLGWEVMGEGAGRRFSHGGSNDGYQCEAMALLEPGNGAVVLTNAESGLILYWEVFAAVARAHGWREFMPPPRTVRAIPPEEMSRYTGVYDIVSGVEMPELKVWTENGDLYTHIQGMRGGPNRTLMDQNGRLFNRSRPSDTEVIYGPDGVARELVLRLFGVAEYMRMRRRV
ncbi:MAG TPA: serine hydrolase domain-containing protein [Caulobacteraceae bacterium]|nr:serine hydrolase domain-containing protein [Caulobacteraceae bacterium]